MGSKGVNVWFDLRTTDVEAAKRFYSETIGWKTQPWEDAPAAKPYTMWVASAGPIGGVVELPAEAVGMGVPPHWMAYTTVEDVDATAALAVEFGAQVAMPPMDIPKVGRVAGLVNPQGALFSIFTPLEAMPPADRTRPGYFSWAELNTTDYEAAWSFYKEVFGWVEMGSMVMEQGGTYFMFQEPNEATVGGMSNMAEQMSMPAHWLHYVTVEDIEATIERIEQQGGKVVNGPMPVPETGLIAHCLDPQGAAFALYQDNARK